MSSKVKAMGSPVRQRLLKEAATLENDNTFKGLMLEHSIEDVLIMFRFNNGHIHSVLPNPDLAQEMLKFTLLNEFAVDVDSYSKPKEEKVKLPRRIIFHNRQAIGDILMFTCAIRDFKRAFPDVEVQVRSTAMHIWDFNKHLNRETWVNAVDPLRFKSGKNKPTPAEMESLNRQAIEVAIKEDKPVLIYIGPGKLTNASNRKDLHFANAYRISMETMLGVQISQGPIRPDIYMTESEYTAPPIIEPPYWLITAGEKGDWTCKTFPFAKWQEVVEKLPQIKFVQLGAKGHKHPQLRGDNVVNFIGETQNPNFGIRMLFNLFNNCEGSMGLVSFQMHLAAAFNKPCITIAGAREPVHFTRYPGQGGYLATDGCLPCTKNSKDVPTACWYCKIERCPYHNKYEGQEVPLCADLITSDDVVSAVLRYYNGGRLDFDKPIGASKLVNVVADPVPIKIDADPVVSDEGMWGFEWGGSSITDRDWEFLKGIVKEYKVKSVLEFGVGFSTLLFNSLGLNVTTYETDQRFIDLVHGKNPKARILKWDGKEVPEILPDGQKPVYDLAFVDGPSGGSTREFSTKYASNHSGLVVIHDAGREWERKWQNKYLKNNFQLISKGGHRCHFWSKGIKPPQEVAGPTIGISEFNKMISTEEGQKRIFEMLQSRRTDTPLIKVVFNGRGDGGAERSVCWIMQQFVNDGWRVEYISPNESPCGTFRMAPIKGVRFLNYLTPIKDPCDILLLYTNDWVWDFPKLTEVFSGLQAKRKVMAVNYKAGNISKLEWTKGWDHYLYLNSTLMEQCDREGTVLPPPTDLSKFLNSTVEYEGNLRIVRHSSQGDVKYPKNFNEMVETIMEEIPDSELYLMPAPSFLNSGLIQHYAGRLHIHKRNQPSVNKFLEQGNLFWYKLPEGGYSEGGPKVIMEAQATGLAVITDNHSGGLDRLRSSTVGLCGFLCDSFDEHLLALKELDCNVELRRKMGIHGRLHAADSYNPRRWILEIVEGSPKKILEIGEQVTCNLIRR